MKEVIEYKDNSSVNVCLLSIGDYPIHYHDDFQIIYVLEGDLKLTLFYLSYVLTPGSIHIIHPMDVHSIESLSKDNLVLILSFDSDYFLKIFPHFNSTVFNTTIDDGSLTKTKTLRDQIFSIVSEDYYQETGYASRINNIAVSLFNTLIKNFRGFVIDEYDRAFYHKTSNDYVQTDRISRIIQYVYENYQYKISLSKIAEREHMSPYYLSHVFHKFVGLNFRDFLSMVRVEMSLRHVLSTNKSVTQIAQEMGFSDAKYYVSTFHAYMGRHPKEYRAEFSSQVYGLSSINVSNFSLRKLEPTIDRYTQYPVFKKNSARTRLLSLDFLKKPIGTLELPQLTLAIPSTFFEFMSDTLPLHRQVDLAEIYQETCVQEELVTLLQEITTNPFNAKMDTIQTMDSDCSRVGLLTANGLKKPLYYFLELLHKLPRNILSYGSRYIILGDSSSGAILIFNPDKLSAVTFDLVINDLIGTYKLTQYMFRTADSCLNYMTQLNFSNSLTSEEFESINAMSRPRVSFEILPSVSRYYKSVELNSYDVLLMHFQKA